MLRGRITEDQLGVQLEDQLEVRLEAQLDDKDSCLKLVLLGLVFLGNGQYFDLVWFGCWHTGPTWRTRLDSNFLKLILLTSWLLATRFLVTILGTRVLARFLGLTRFLMSFLTSFLGTPGQLESQLPFALLGEPSLLLALINGTNTVSWIFIPHRDYRQRGAQRSRFTVSQ